MAGFGARWVGQDAAKALAFGFEVRQNRGTPQSRAATGVNSVLMIVNVAATVTYTGVDGAPFTEEPCSWLCAQHACEY